MGTLEEGPWEEWWSADGQVVFHGEMLAEEGIRYWKEGKASPNGSSHF